MDIYNLPDPQKIDGNPNNWVDNILIDHGFIDEKGNVLKHPRPLLIDRHKSWNWHDIKRKNRVIR